MDPLTILGYAAVGVFGVGCVVCVLGSVYLYFRDFLR